MKLEDKRKTEYGTQLILQHPVAKLTSGSKKINLELVA
jgi:hypothetical protein